MNAVEFIKKFGWNKAKSTVDSFNGVFHKLDENENVIFTFQIDDLKQLVDAWELVQVVGGIEKAKTLLRMRIAAELYDSADEIEQAIELVESVK